MAMLIFKANAMLEALVFFAVTAVLVYLSRGPLRNPGSHGFYRFFAWECILCLVLLNFPSWTVDPVSPHQLLSWALLSISIWLPIHAVKLLKTLGKPTQERDDAALYGFEKTSSLVSSGAFRYIRHPMYAALIFLAWGVFLKQFSWLGLCLVLAATILLLLTALTDEKECLAHFGDEYRSYMRQTKRFIPFLF